jgi:dTDP-4-amino-4,6-dideoxygalactose transaminase
MRDSFLSFSPPDIGDEEIAEVVDCLRSGWITTGPRTARFEEEFATYVGAEAALALSSGTAALHVALAAHGIGPGDSVIVPTMTFSSVAHTVEHVGAAPVFVDCEPDTLNLDPAHVKRALSDASVRCVAPVHLYGHPCDPRIIELAGGRAVVDDAAHALPARSGEACVGGSRRENTLTVFSFYATKNLTTGEGGMLTGSRALIEEARAWSLHGMTKDALNRYEEGGSWRYDVTRAGFKANMSDIQAALGMVQLRRLPQMHARRKEIAHRYANALKEMAEIELPVERPDVVHAWHIYAVRLHLDGLKINRDRFIQQLRRRNIGTSVHFIPIHMLSYYRDKYGYRPNDFPVASQEFERLISLPIHSRMTDADVDDVIEAVADVARAHRR